MKNIHLFYSYLKNESRLEKEIHTLKKLKKFKNILVVGFNKNSKTESEFIDEGVTFLRISTFHFNKNGYLRKVFALISIINFLFKIFKYLISFKPNYITVHNPILLIHAYFYTIFNDSKIIYAPHELEIHKTGLSFFMKLITYIIEKFLIKKCHNVVVVSKGICEWYKKKYNISNIYYAPNIPIKAKFNKGNDLFRKKFNIPKNNLISIYQGILTKYRGIKDLIDAYKDLPRHHLVIMGFGPLQQEIIKISDKYNNIHFHDAVSVKKILNFTSSADIGIFFNCKKMSKSYEMSMPNKFFEYSISDLYLIVSSNFVDQSRIILQRKLGSVVKPNIISLKKKLKELKRRDIDNSILLSKNLDHL